MAYNLGGVNPYLSGNVTIDNNRYMDYFLKQQAHQDALKQAYQRNLAEQSSKLTPTGVDTKEVADDKGVLHSDIGDFNNAKNQWLQHSMANAKVLANSNNPNFQKAYLDNQQLYNKTLDILDKSKQKIQNLPKYADLAMKNTGVDMQDDYHRASLPLSHPLHQDFDVSKVLTPQPFDVVADQSKTRMLPQFKEQEKGTTYGNTDMNQFLPDKKTVNPNFLKQSVTKTFGHTPEQVQGIATLGTTEYNTNPKLKNFIDNNLSKQIAANPDLYKHYDDVLFKNTGKHMVLDPTHLQGAGGHQDLAAAFKLDNTILPDRTLSESQIDKIAKDNYDRNQNDIITRQHIALNKAAQDGGYDPQAHVDAIWESRDTSPLALDKIHVGGQEIKGAPVPLPPEIASKIVRKGFGNTQIKPTTFFMSEDKKNIYPVYETGDKTASGSAILEAKPEDRIPVSTGLIPDLGKAFGGTPYTRKNLQFAPPAPTKVTPVKNKYQFLKPHGDGITINRKVKDDNWTVSKNIEGASHDDGGVAENMNGKPVNVEGGELKITNGDGHDAIIPKKWVQRVKSFLKIGDNKAVTKIVESLPKDPSIAEDGGSYSGDDKDKVVVPANYKPLSIPQRNDWNQFLDYLHTKGVSGSKDLDVKDKSLGLGYLAQFQKENPNTTVTSETIPQVQYEQNQLRKGTQFGSFTPQELKEWQAKNADFVNRPVSPVDNWLGSVTSKLYYPQASQVFTNSEGKEIKPPINFGTDIESYHRAVKKVDATAKK